MLGFVCMVSISATNTYANEVDKKVNLNIPHNMNALITYGHCKVNSKVKDEKIVVLSDIIEKEKDKVDNLFNQNKICIDNSNMYKKQAEEWKVEYKKTIEELKKAKDWPWWKFDVKSVVTGVIIPIAIKLIWLL